MTPSRLLAVAEPTSTDWYLEHPISETLLIAPPGCGKTDGIARWVKAVVGRNELKPPRRALGLTFSNKAKANLRSRLHGELGPRWWRWVTVTNFHGWAFHVYQHHCASIGRSPLKKAPQRGRQASLVRSICNEYSCDATELGHALRTCKIGPFSEKTVLEKLESHGLQAAIEYQKRLQVDVGVDFDDLLRLGLLVLQNRKVVSLYRERFALVVVDEVQDLSLGHFDLIAPIGSHRTLWTGDPAQGIYGFAGAQPDLVFEKILRRCTHHLKLTASFRSSPAVLRAVSALSAELGGQEIHSAREDEWEGLGNLLALRSRHVTQEADWVVSKAKRWMDDDPTISIAVIARTKLRRKWVDASARQHNLQTEIWDYPAHKPLIADLLTRHLPAIDTSLPVGEAVEALYFRCLEDIDSIDLDSLDELIEVFDTIGDLVSERPLAEIIAGIRISSTPEDPVGPGLHLLNGHIGKGQQFDRVIIVGLEEAFLPHYSAIKSGQPEDIDSELAVLHVMASRAREQLIVATCDVVPMWNGDDLRRTPSRWFGIIEEEVDDVIDLRGP